MVGLVLYAKEVNRVECEICLCVSWTWSANMAICAVARLELFEGLCLFVEGQSCRFLTHKDARSDSLLASFVYNGQL